MGVTGEDWGDCSKIAVLQTKHGVYGCESGIPSRHLALVAWLLRSAAFPNLPTINCKEGSINCHLGISETLQQLPAAKTVPVMHIIGCQYSGSWSDHDINPLVVENVWEP